MTGEGQEGGAGGRGRREGQGRGTGGEYLFIFEGVGCENKTNNIYIGETRQTSTRRVPQ